MALIFNHPSFNNNKWQINCVKTVLLTNQLSKIVDTYMVELSDLEEEATIAEIEAAATAIIQAQ